MFAKVKKLNVKYNGKIASYLAELDDEKIAFQQVQKNNFRYKRNYIK